MVLLRWSVGAVGCARFGVLRLGADAAQMLKGYLHNSQIHKSRFQVDYNSRFHFPIEASAISKKVNIHRRTYQNHRRDFDRTTKHKFLGD